MPDVLDKLDIDRTVDAYGDLLGVPARLRSRMSPDQMSAFRRFANVQGHSSAHSPPISAQSTANPKHLTMEKTNAYESQHAGRVIAKLPKKSFSFSGNHGHVLMNAAETAFCMAPSLRIISVVLLNQASRG